MELLLSAAVNRLTPNWRGGVHAGKLALEVSLGLVPSDDVPLLLYSGEQFLFLLALDLGRLLF